MPRPSKGPRLYLRKGRVDRRTGQPIPAYWFIRDGAAEIGTGCPEDRLKGEDGAEAALGTYIAQKWAPQVAAAINKRDPAQVIVAEVLALYAAEIGPKGMDRSTFDGMALLLEDRLGHLPISEIKRSSCKAYVDRRILDPDRRYKDHATAPRVSSETARRELEILSAAIGHWDGENKLSSRPDVWLPDKPESPRDALTRSQAAALLWAAMGWRRYERHGPVRPREAQPWGWERLGASARANRAHLRRFALLGLYTGSRHSVMTSLLWEEAATDPWVDLDKGMIYRRGRAERDQATKRRPVVKMPRRLLTHMRRWRRLDVAKAHAYVEGIRAAGLDPAREPPLYTSVLHHGGYPIAGKIRTGFEGCVRDAGLPAEITPHWMRHTCATWLMEAGVDMWDAAAFTGMTVAVLETHYAHHRPDYQASASTAAARKR